MPYSLRDARHTAQTHGPKQDARRAIADSANSRPAGPQILCWGSALGIGDDCALLAEAGRTNCSNHRSCPSPARHFRLDWHPPEVVGHRTLARGLSDLAAMGARPLAAFLSLGLPQELTRAKDDGKPRGWIASLMGFLALAEAHKTPLAGGDLAQAPLAVADIVLVGAVPRGRALLRSGRAGRGLALRDGKARRCCCGIGEAGRAAAFGKAPPSSIPKECRRSSRRISIRSRGSHKGCGCSARAGDCCHRSQRWAFDRPGPSLR